LLRTSISGFPGCSSSRTRTGAAARKYLFCAIALKQRTIIEIPGFRVIPLKNRCRPLNISAAAAASKILAKKFCARAYNPSQQGFSVLQLPRGKKPFGSCEFELIKN
jgi:hypothetical protein